MGKYSRRRPHNCKTGHDRTSPRMTAKWTKKENALAKRAKLNFTVNMQI